MKKDQQPEVVVITGASAGIGRATVRAFARRGASLGLLALGQEGLEGARREVEKLGGQAVVVPTDVADPEQVERAAVTVEKAFGPIDVWINNAMVSVLSPVKDMTAEEFQRVTNVKYLGYVHGTLSALRRMLPPRSGSHYPSRQRVGVPRDSTSIGVLWCQACCQRIYGVTPV